MKNISVFSFFSGIGFLDLGFETEGYRIDFVNEYCQPFLNGYKHSRKKLNIPEPRFGYSSESISVYLEGKNRASLKEMIQKTKREERLTGFIGGPPCPDFSIGGKNAGREGDNGKLSQVYVELILQQKPDFFLFENVKGLWQTKRHREFYEELKSKLHKKGYYTTEKLINAIEYGAPQDRERIILLGFNTDILSKSKLTKINGEKNLPATSFPWEKHVSFSKDAAFQFPWPETTPFREDSRLLQPNGVPEKLTVEHWFTKNQVTAHENARHCFRPKAGLVRFQSVDEGDDTKKSFKRLHRWRYSPTACYGNNEVHLHPYKARRISAAEALAIQSLPGKFCLPETMTLSQMFKSIGNGVPYVAARGIAKSLHDFLGSLN